MFSTFERMISVRYLKPRRKEGFISVIAGFSLLGIMLGVATLIIVLSVMNGFRAELMSRILGLNGHLGVYATELPFDDFDPVASRLRLVDGVVSVTPMIEGHVMATANGQASGALVRGVRGDDFRDRPILADNIVTGSLENFGQGDGLVLGDRMAKKMGLRAGDKITLISPTSSSTIFGSAPRMKAFPIVATFNVGMYEYDSTFIFMPLEMAQIYFKMPAAITGLEIMGTDPDDIYVLRDAVGRALADNFGTGFRLYDWRQANASFFNAIEVERNVMFLILTLIILVAAFNIISSMIMLVKDKGQDIAILRTMGASRASVMRIFFMSGASIGVAGTFLGFALGLAFAQNIESIRRWLEGLSGSELFAAEIYFLSKLPAIVYASDVVLVVVMSLVCSFLATLYPSWRASRLDPVEALRYE